MAPGETSDFLAAEAEANRLVDELRELKHEVASYKEARTALGTAAEQLGIVASRLSELADATAKNVKTLREIGGPQLLETQRKTIEQLDSGFKVATTGIATVQAELGRMRKLLVGVAVGATLGVLLILTLLLVR